MAPGLGFHSSYHSSPTLNIRMVSPDSVYTSYGPNAIGGSYLNEGAPGSRESTAGLLGEGPEEVPEEAQVWAPGLRHEGALGWGDGGAGEAAAISAAWPLLSSYSGASLLWCMCSTWVVGGCACPPTTGGGGVGGAGGGGAGWGKDWGCGVGLGFECGRLGRAGWAMLTSCSKYPLFSLVGS